MLRTYNSGFLIVVVVPVKFYEWHGLIGVELNQEMETYD